MYDSQIGLWAATDPYDQFAGPYSGMGSNPVNCVDPSGGWSFFDAIGTALTDNWIGTAIGAVGGATIFYLASRGANGSNTATNTLIGFLGGAIVGNLTEEFGYNLNDALFDVAIGLDFLLSNGSISIKNSNNKLGYDRLFATNGDLIDDNVAKGLLNTNLDFDKKVSLFKLDKTNLYLRDYLSDLFWRVSFYEQREISWGWFEPDDKSEGYIVVNPMSKSSNTISDSKSPVKFTFSRGGKTYTIQEDYHSHPGLVLGLGNRYPSPDDETRFSLMYQNVNKNVKAFIYSRQGISQYTATGTIPSNYKPWNSPWDFNYINNVLKWKKVF